MKKKFLLTAEFKITKSIIVEAENELQAKFMIDEIESSEMQEEDEDLILTYVEEIVD